VVLIAGLLIGQNVSTSPDHHGAWCLEMAYDELLMEFGPGQPLLLAVGVAMRTLRAMGRSPSRG
jgi:hypothetical protein